MKKLMLLSAISVFTMSFMASCENKKETNVDMTTDTDTIDTAVEPMDTMTPAAPVDTMTTEGVEPMDTTATNATTEVPK